MTYKIAYAKENGDWDITETFDAENDCQAMDYAEKMLPDDENWYVLDEIIKILMHGSCTN
jgi:hypothetical protein